MRSEIYCINLHERKDKHKFMKNQFDKYKLDVTFIQNYKHKKGGRYGCFESHIMTLIDAEKKDLDVCLVFEDDCYIYNNVRTKIKECFKFILKNNIYLLKSSKSDGIYDVKNNFINNTYFCKGYITSNICYFVNREFRKIILNNYNKYIEKKPVDIFYNFLCPKDKFYVYNNYIGKLAPFSSDNSPWRKNSKLSMFFQYYVYKYNTDLFVLKNNLTYIYLVLIYIIFGDVIYTKMISDMLKKKIKKRKLFMNKNKF